MKTLLIALIIALLPLSAQAALGPHEPKQYPDLIRVTEILALADHIEAYRKKTGHYPLVTEPQQEMLVVALTNYRANDETAPARWQQLEEALQKELGPDIKLRFDPSEGQQGVELRMYQYATDGQDYYVSAVLSTEAFYARRSDDTHHKLELTSHPNKKDEQYTPRQLRHFLQHGPDDLERQIALVAALAEKNYEDAKAAIAGGANVNPACDFQTRCLPLADAAQAGDTEKIAFLLDNGADINGFTSYYDVPLISALSADKDDAVKLLLERGADVNIPNAFGISPFIGACAEGDVEKVKLMLEKGGNPNRVYFAYNSEAQPGDTGDRPLEAAIRGNHAGVVELLLKAGADVSLKGHAGSDMLDLAIGTRNPAIISLIKAAQKK